MQSQDVLITDEIRREWTAEQNRLKEQLITFDDFDYFIPDAPPVRCWIGTHDSSMLQSIDRLIEFVATSNLTDDEEKSATGSPRALPPLRYIGGVDISHGADDTDLACAGLVVVEYPSLNEVYRKFNMVRYTQPYISGFLAFREVDFLVEIIEEMRAQKCPFLPEVILVDGNGILHHRGFGLASHLGVLCGIPTIGIGKNLLHIDGLDAKKTKKECSNLQRKGDHLRLLGQTDLAVHGVAIRCGVSRPKRPNEGKNPIFVSIGHRVSLSSAISIVLICSKDTVTTIPEPILFADNGTRDAIKEYEKAIKK